MTLVEIKKQIPVLQGKVTKITKVHDKYQSEVSKILAKRTSIETLISDDILTIENCKKFIQENENSNDPDVKARVEARRKTQEDAEASLKQKQEELQKVKEERIELDKKPEYAEIEKKLAETKKQLEDVCDLVIKDPKINQQIQIAIKEKYYVEIEKRNAEIEKYKNINDAMAKSLKSDGAYELKSFVDSIIEARAEKKKADEDPKADSNAAKKKYYDSISALQGAVKDKFGLDIDEKDALQILSMSVDKNIGDNYVFPFIDSKISEISKVVSRLKDSREKTLTRVEGMKEYTYVKNPEDEAKIEENNRKISDIRKTISDSVDKEISLNDQQIKTNDDAISDLQDKIDENDREIDRIQDSIDSLQEQIDDIQDQIDEKKAGSSSEEYKQLLEAKEQLKSNNIIVEDALPDLKNPDSDLSKKFQEFVKADLEVRKAFALCKTSISEDALENLQRAIQAYDAVTLDLEDLSDGYKPRAWQGYLKETLNRRIDNGETIDNVYYHPENKNFDKIADDKNVAKNEDALDAHYQVRKKLGSIDAAESKILNGDSRVPLGELFFDRSVGYQKLMKEFEGVANFPSGLAFEMMGDTKLIKPSLFTKIKNAIQKATQTVTQRKFNLPGKNREALIENFNSKNTEEARRGEEGENTDDLELRKMQLRQEIERLRTEGRGIIDQRARNNTQVGQKIEENEKLQKRNTDLGKTKTDFEKQISDLEEENRNLRGHVVPQPTSGILQTEEIDFVTKDDYVVRKSLEKLDVDKKIREDLDDEER